MMMVGEDMMEEAACDEHSTKGLANKLGEIGIILALSRALRCGACLCLGAVVCMDGNSGRATVEELRAAEMPAPAP